jgi:F420-dependent methylenetetrahydromethanopterin dehydrogenase
MMNEAIEVAARAIEYEVIGCCCISKREAVYLTRAVAPALMEEGARLAEQKIRKQAAEDMVDAIYRTMPHADGHEAKAFVAHVLEEFWRQ